MKIILAIAVATLGLASVSGSTHAAVHFICQSNTVSVKMRVFAQNRPAAQQTVIAAWSSKVQKISSPDFSLWGYAQGQYVKCNVSQAGAANPFVCIAKATPCEIEIF